MKFSTSNIEGLTIEYSTFEKTYTPTVFFFDVCYKFKAPERYDMVDWEAVRDFTYKALKPLRKKFDSSIFAITVPDKVSLYNKCKKVFVKINAACLKKDEGQNIKDTSEIDAFLLYIREQIALNFTLESFV